MYDFNSVRHKGVNPIKHTTSKGNGLSSKEDSCQIPTETELQKLVDRLCQHYFNYPFDGTVQWSKRLSRTAGRCDVTFKNGQLLKAKIILSLAYYQNYGLEELENIIKHELAHYHLFRTTGSKHRHNSTAFKNLLTYLGAPRYAKPLTSPDPKANSTCKNKPIYVYVCPTCGHRYPRRRRIKGSCSICDKKYNPKHLLVLV